ncbi:MAG TPA: hemerythrin domain-containing protein [Candidatus Aminicenantes bacterium]|nr:hemerythrin domain-containing protein [Candidatus Aminicenantes bacterium]
MTATEMLVEEHDLIQKVLDWGETELARIAAGGRPDAGKLLQAVDFIRNFADRCHHAKEEGALFRRLVQKGMPRDNGPIAVMLHEHEQGRAHVAALAAAIAGAARGDAGAVAALREHLGGYIALLRAHIDKEDRILYPMADRLLAPEDQEWLEREFARVEREETGAGVHEKYHRLAEELAGG